MRISTSAAVLAALAGAASTLIANPFSATLNLSTSVNGVEAMVFHGVGANDATGNSVAGVGDFNGDGYGDLLIGASNADPGGVTNSGAAYLVFGGPALGSSPVVELSSLDGSDGFILRGGAASDNAGVSLSAAGDVNADGFADIIIGANNADPEGVSGAGEAYVVFGGPSVGAGGSLQLSSLSGADGFVIRGIDASDSAGISVASAGDFNGDSFPDLLIGASNADPNGISNAGEAYVVFGGPGIGASGVVKLSGLTGPDGFVINGIDTSDNSGFAVAGVGDVNGDGVDDVLIGARYADPLGVNSAGEAYIVFGGAGVGASGSLNLSSLNGANGYVLNGIDATDIAGFAVGPAGDFNADGSDDLLIGARNADPAGQSNAGEAYAVFAGAGVGAAGSLNLSTLAGPNGFAILGASSSDSLGYFVTNGRDINGDGYPDAVFGAPAADPTGVATGVTYVLFGGPGVGAPGTIQSSSLDGLSGFAVRGAIAFDQVGIAGAGAGDVNGDGLEDLLIGANGLDPNGITSAGGAYLVFGRTAQRWSSASGGSWDNAAKWLSGAAPARGPVFIDTVIGVTVAGPADTATLTHLTLGAEIGRTTLDLQPFSLVTIADALEIPPSAAITGAGVLVTDAGLTNAGLLAPDDLMLIADAGLTNHATLELVALGAAAPAATLACFGAIDNTAAGEIVIQGSASLSADAITNAGETDIAFATATIDAPFTNAGTPNGPGFDPLGALTIAGASQVLFASDVLNQSEIVLTSDSSIVILGELSGNGVSGPGGGAAGTVFAKGGISPGFLLMTGIASFDGPLDLGPANVTTIRIGGTTPGATHDQVATGATLSAGGTLEVVLTNGHAPVPGAEYKILDFASVSGAFASIVLDPALLSAGADTSTLLIDGTIRIPSPTCAGDINGDGFTNASDFVILAGNFGASVPANTGGDLNGDGTVNASDFVILAGDFGCGD